jgi:hypothetical protein
MVYYVFKKNYNVLMSSFAGLKLCRICVCGIKGWDQR